MGRTRKGLETRRRILDAALELFRDRGYEGVGVRDVAERAEVSLGSAYYYFESKDHLVQAIYERTHEEHVAALAPLLEEETRLERRLHALLVSKVESAEPYHAFSAHIFRSAADPRSPLSPFGDETRPVRDAAIDLVERVVEGSDAKIPKDLRADLPRLLWFYEMAIILYWIHDDSKGRARTRLLIDHSVKIVVSLLKISGLPPFRPVRKRILTLLHAL